MPNSTQDICSPLFIEKQAADYLTRSVSSLRRDRKRGTGPTFLKIGRSVRYRRSELDEYISSCTRVVGRSEVNHG
jgi:predicted DNA-binding transcriptional regulator AlpA